MLRLVAMIAMVHCAAAQDPADGWYVAQLPSACNPYTTRALPSYPTCNLIAIRCIHCIHHHPLAGLTLHTDVFTFTPKSLQSRCALLLDSAVGPPTANPHARAFLCHAMADALPSRIAVCFAGWHMRWAQFRRAPRGSRSCRWRGRCRRTRTCRVRSSRRGSAWTQPTTSTLSSQSTRECVRAFVRACVRELHRSDMCVCVCVWWYTWPAAQHPRRITRQLARRFVAGVHRVLSVEP
jgi:hypothetical protein